MRILSNSKHSPIGTHQQTMMFKPSLSALTKYITALEKHNWVYAYNDNRRVYCRGKAAQTKLEATALTHPLYQKAFDIWYSYVSFAAATCPDRELRKNSAISSLYAEQMITL
jgi:hypothetical protein